MVWRRDSTNRLAKSLETLIDEIDRRFPKRDDDSDGTIGDKRHQSLGSATDHNPHIRHGSTGVVTALDVTHDPSSGFDAGAFAESLRESKDPRIKYVIFNGRIFSSTQTPWVWRKRNKGPGDHTQHVHISVVKDPKLFDDTKPWSFDLSNSLPTDGDTEPPRPKLKLGSTGPAVVDLQNLLGIEADGVFGTGTDQAVRDFQARHNLFVDGIVGSHTWGVLSQVPTKPQQEIKIASLPPAAIDEIARLAGASELARVRWKDRGVAPIGYIKGMAVTFGHVYAKLKAGDSAARLMAAMNSGNDVSDALAWYDSRFGQAGMDNSRSGAETLRHLFVLLIGLGMRESSGKYFEGRDMSAENTDADTAEAGLFQMSWNMKSASQEMPRLFAVYSADPEGFASIFKEGTPAPKPSDQENPGTGEGVAYQRLCKSCPAFAVETAAVGLRVRRKHWGPINRHEAEIRLEAEKLLREVEGIVDAHEVVTVPLPEEGEVPMPPVKVPPLTDERLQLVVLILTMLLKEKPMGEGSEKPGQVIDPAKILPLLLQPLLSGKPVNVVEILTMLLTGQPVGKTPPQSGQSDQLGRLVDLVATIVTKKDGQQPATGPVNNALGETVGKLLNGKKTALGTIGALVTALVSQAPDGAGTALGGLLSQVPVLAGLSGPALPVFLALTGWGVLGKLEKWTQRIAQSQK